MSDPHAHHLEIALEKIAAGAWEVRWPSHLYRCDGLFAPWTRETGLLTIPPFVWEVRLSWFESGDGRLVGHVGSRSAAAAIATIDETWALPAWWPFEPAGVEIPAPAALPIAAGAAATAVWLGDHRLQRLDGVQLRLVAGLGLAATWTWGVWIPEASGGAGRVRFTVGPCDPPTAMASVDAALPMAPFWSQTKETP